MTMSEIPTHTPATSPTCLVRMAIAKMLPYRRIPETGTIHPIFEGILKAAIVASHTGIIRQETRTPTTNCQDDQNRRLDRVGGNSRFSDASLFGCCASGSSFMPWSSRQRLRDA